MIDWQVGRNNWENSHNHANHIMFLSPTWSLLFCICYCVLFSYAESWQSSCSQCTSFFFFFFSFSLSWFCSEVHLSEEKPAAVVELAVASSGPVGDWLSLLWCWCTPPYLRLNQTVLNHSALFWEPCSLWLGFPQNCKTSTARMWQFSPQGNSLVQ